jgi:hypothetical protein
MLWFPMFQRHMVRALADTQKVDASTAGLREGNGHPLPAQGHGITIKLGHWIHTLSALSA